MGWVSGKDIRIFGVLGAHEFMRDFTAQFFEVFRVVVGPQKGLQVGVEFGQVGVVVALDGGLFQGAVHPLDLAVGLEVGHLGAAVLDAVFGAHGVEQVRLRSLAVGRAVALRWSDGSTGTILRVTQAGTYTLLLTGECNTRTASRRVEYQPCFIIPNNLTANKDAKSYCFAIEGLPLGVWTLKIYSRWSDKVYETNACRND